MPSLKVKGQRRQEYDTYVTTEYDIGTPTKLTLTIRNAQKVLLSNNIC